MEKLVVGCNASTVIEPVESLFSLDCSINEISWKDWLEEVTASSKGYLFWSVPSGALDH